MISKLQATPAGAPPPEALVMMLSKIDQELVALGQRHGGCARAPRQLRLNPEGAG